MRLHWCRRAREGGVLPVHGRIADSDASRGGAVGHAAVPGSAAGGPDWEQVHRELRRHKGVTLRLLWLEHRTVHPNGYQYSRFCEGSKAAGTLDVVLRQTYLNLPTTLRRFLIHFETLRVSSGTRTG